MRLNLEKEWLIKRAERDDRAEISAGFFNLDWLKKGEQAQKTRTDCAAKEEGEHLAFGKLINLCRRERGLRLQDLAEKARIDVAELCAIERDLRYTAEPRTVYQLAVTLGFPKDKLLQLSGNVRVKDAGLHARAVRFAAKSESVERLTEDEHRALEEFVKFLSEK